MTAKNHDRETYTAREKFIAKKNLSDYYFKGKANIELKGRKARLANKKHSGDGFLEHRNKKIFEYRLLLKKYKKIVDWLFDSEDKHSEVEYKGIRIKAVIYPLVHGFFPEGFDIEKLISWIEEFREKAEN